jgi:hypothetical protein
MVTHLPATERAEKGNKKIHAAQRADARKKKQILTQKKASDHEHALMNKNKGQQPTSYSFTH